MLIFDHFGYCLERSVKTAHPIQTVACLDSPIQTQSKHESKQNAFLESQTCLPMKLSQKVKKEGRRTSETTDPELFSSGRRVLLFEEGKPSSF